jgi:hypothetical protein
MLSSMPSFPLPHFGANRRKSSTQPLLTPAVSKQVLSDLSSIQQRQQSIMGAQKYIQGELQNIGTLLASVQQQIQTPKPAPKSPQTKHPTPSPASESTDYFGNGQWDVNTPADYYTGPSSTPAPVNGQEMNPNDFNW